MCVLFFQLRCVCGVFFGVDRRRLFPACGLQNVQRDLHGPTAAEPSHGALVSASAGAPEAHGLFPPGQHLPVDISRFEPAECGCFRTAAATTPPGPELRSIRSWRLRRRPRPDGEALVCLPQDEKTHRRYLKHCFIHESVAFHIIYRFFK